jgi:choline-sulfatase
MSQMKQKEKPDILFFFSDQHHAHYTGYAGNVPVETPNLDRIARQGTAFRSAYTPCPLCVPARRAWNGYLSMNKRQGIFIYASDHGDTCGEHGIFGKTTFLEGSSGVPVVFEGPGIGKNTKLWGAVSLLDMGPTLCEIAGVEPPPAQDGRSLLKALYSGKDDINRTVLSEFISAGPDNKFYPGRMLRKGKWKLIHYYLYDKYDLLFNLETDPQECRNVRSENPEIYKRLLTGLKKRLGTRKSDFQI